MAQDEKSKSKKAETSSLWITKKVDRGGELPPGWQKKLVRGEVIDRDILRHAKIVKNSDYSEYPYKTKNIEVYKVQDKIIKVMRATNIIMDVLDSK